MQRTRDWRRHQFLKRRKQQLRFINTRCAPCGEHGWDERIAENKEELKKGGLKRHWLIRYHRDDPWFWWLVEDKKKKKDRPLDKEWESWYD